MRLYEFFMRRLILSIVVLLGLSVVIFALSRSAGDPVRAYVDPRMPKEQVELIRRLYGLDQPLYIQYYYWLGAALRGDLGISQTFNYQPVAKVIISYMPITFELAIYVLVISIPLGIYLGTKSATNKDTWIDHACRLLAISGQSMPAFFFALLVAMVLYPRGIIVFAPQFTFPVFTGMPTVDAILTGDMIGLVEAFRYLIGPLLVQVYTQLAVNTRILRASVLQELGRDYITTGLAKGLSPKYVNRHYAVRNALLPFVTLSGLQVVWLMTGTVITEVVFNRKGLGYFMSTAAIAVDHNAVLGYVLVLGSLLVLANMLIDVLYAYLDPRVRLG